MSSLRQIVLDTETTGLSAAAGDRIIEIGCVELVGRRLTGHNFHRYLNPGRDSHPDALKVHGITREFLQDKPRFPDIADELLAYLAGAEIIIHNASFDVSFLDKELELAGRPQFREHVAEVTDTLPLAKQLYPGKRNSLDALCDRLGVNNSGRKLHGALLDAELLADVYINMTRGQDALLVEVPETARIHAQTVVVDLGQLELPVIRASAQEASAHAAMLADIDKASKGATLWTRLVQAGTVA